MQVMSLGQQSRGKAVSGTIARRAVQVLPALCLLMPFAAAAGVATFTVNSLADPGAGGCDVAECTLREAIAASAFGGGIVEFDQALSGTIVLGSELFINFNGLVINGPGPDRISVSGNDAVRVFRLFATDAVIRGLTIRDGNSTSAAPNASGAGFYITNGSNVVLENLRIVDNFTDLAGGGGVNVFFAGATIRNSEISGNTASRGSGIAINGSAGHTVVVENTTVSGNIANQSESGIGVLTNAGQSVLLRHVTVAANSGAPFGALIGGNGQTIIEASIFADNDAPSGDLALGANDLVNNSVIETSQGTLNGDNNVSGIDVSLVPLAPFQGSVLQVHAISTPPARDLVDNALGNPGCGTTVTSDQIGNPRPSGLRCDAGAFEARAPELLAHWEFDEYLPDDPLVAGDRVLDSSGNNRDARIEQAPDDLPTAVDGRLLGDTAFAFDSSPDRVVFEPGFDFGDGGPVAATAIDFAQDDSFTLEALVRIPDGSTQVGALISKDVGPNQPSWWFRVNNGVLEGIVEDGPANALALGSVAINDGEWHHVAMVRDASFDTLALFVDRMLDVQVADATTGDSINANDIVLGAFNAGTRQLTGELDFARITRGALGVGEFVQLSNGIDLMVSIEDGTSIALPGSLVDYVVTVENIGDESAVDALVTDTHPIEFLGTSWTCAASVDASCPASGSGPIAAAVTIPGGGSVVFSVAATITDGDFSAFEYSAQVALDAQVDQDPGNNVATDLNRNTPVFADGFEELTVTGKAGSVIASLSAGPKGSTVRPGSAARLLGHGRTATGTLVQAHFRVLDGRTQVRLSHRKAADAPWQVGAWQRATIENRRVLLDH